MASMPAHWEHGSTFATCPITGALPVMLPPLRLRQAVFFVLQQITGINIPFYYGPTLLQGYLTSGKSAVDIAVAGLEAATILGVVNEVATLFAFRYIDKAGRRKLAIGGFLGMAVFILVAAFGVARLTVRRARGSGYRVRCPVCA